MRRTGPTNVVLRKLIRELRKASSQQGVEIWDYVAEMLERPARRRVAVNLSKINRYASQSEYVVVPGKVLGSGVLEKPVVVAALSFSRKALEKIGSAGGTALSIRELVRLNPHGSNVRVIA